MFAYLIFRACCEFYVFNSAPKDPNQAFFNLQVAVSEISKRNDFTYNKEGFYVALRFYDKDDNVSNITLLTASNPTVTSPFDSLTVKGSVSNDENNAQYLNVQFDVTNNNYFPRKIDVGVFAKLAASNDKVSNKNVKVKSYNELGLQLAGQTSSYTDMLLKVQAKRVGYPDASGYHFDTYNFNQNDPTQFPYWSSEHSRAATTTSDQSIISLHWSKQVIPGGQTKTLGFVITGADFTNFRPFLEDETPRKQYYSPGDKVTIKIHGTNHEIENYNIYLKLPGQTAKTAEKFKCEATAFNADCTITKDITIGEVDSYVYEYWSVDQGIKSIVRSSSLPVSKPPTLTITKSPLEEPYNQLEFIDIAGTISDDESKVYIKFQFDNGRVDEIQKTDVTATGINFDVKIQIPKEIKPGNDHKLSIWLVDDDGVEIPRQNFTIKVKPPTKPEIKSAYVGNKNRFHNGIPWGTPGAQVVLFGVAIDKEFDKNLSLYVKFGDNPQVNFGNITVTEEPEPFAIYYTIPQTTEYKIYDVEFEAVDFTGEHSDKKVVKFEVRDPTLPPPTPSPRPAKFVYSEPSSEEACFDLKYQEDNRPVQSLSYNNEGFFVAYRIYNDDYTRILNETYIKKADKLESTTGDIHVKVSIEDEPLFENYTRLVFNVTNNGYFNKIIDLGVFVDSMFASDDNNPISRRADNLGFVVSGRDLYYTVFTNNFLSNKEVDKSYIGPVTRNNGKIENMPTFLGNGRDAETTSQQNSAYAFSWTTQQIKAETSMIFAVTLAPDKFIPTPSVIEEETDYPNGEDYLQPGEAVTFEFKISDADINQLINVTFEANGEKYTGQGTITAQKSFFIFSQEIVIPTNQLTFSYSAYATDASGSWASNKISRTIILLTDSTPVMEENVSPRGRAKYPVGGKVHITGQLYTYTVPSHIRWQWNYKSKIETGSVQYEPNRSNSPSNYDIEIPIPTLFQANERVTLKYWVENTLGQRSDENGNDHVYSFTLGNPPSLTEVGFSVESARVNDQVVAYVLMSDKEVGRDLRLFYKIDSGSFGTSPIKKFSAKDSETPYGFFFTVPNTETGSHTISFMVKDEDDFTSEPYNVKLYVA